jgi:hypothetical protein
MNNMAEYEALIHRLRVAKDTGIKRIVCCGDSDLVSQQVAGTWNARNPKLCYRFILNILMLANIVKEFFNIVFPNYGATNYCKVFLGELGEQHGELEQGGN